MAVKLSDKPNVPKYQRIREQLESDLQKGLYHKGAKLPSQYELAKRFNVSLLTMRQALSILENDGLIARKHGKGTFITNCSQQDQRKVNVALVFAESFKDNSSYQRSELQILENMLSLRDRHLVLATLTAKDIVRGNVPPVLESETVAGILLENFVQDIHVEFLKSKGFPLVVIGSHNINQDVAQVIYNQGKAAYLMSKALLNFGRGPLYFVTEPFKYHYTYELVEGYSRACKEHNRQERLRTVMNEEKDPYSEILKIVEEEAGQFSLLIHANIAHAIVDIFKTHNLQLEDHPVAIYGAADYVPPDVRRKLNQCTLDIRKGTEVAVETLNRVIDGEKIGQVILEPVLHTNIEDGLLRMKLDWNKPMEME